MDLARRRQLRQVLQTRYPWVTAADVGPSAVEAGECDRCGTEARLVATCGPGVDQYLGRHCVEQVGEDGWCSGHATAALAAADAIAALPAEADTVARLWWVATGEVRVDLALLPVVAHLGMPDP